jgi:hypothetical protein
MPMQKAEMLMVFYEQYVKNSGLCIRRLAYLLICRLKAALMTNPRSIVEVPNIGGNHLIKALNPIRDRNSHKRPIILLNFMVLFGKNLLAPATGVGSQCLLNLC